uniref:Expansin-like EG45 domain-containing protein n=1 Tax=Hyaloperonospora arabidopsidis (strain Emoy2) TaxID=559515 RepID=M4BG11_HYAAE
MDSSTVGDYYAALNRKQWHSTLNCGRCAEVSGDDPTLAATVYIVDECPDCKTGGLGLSPTVLKQLSSNGHSTDNIRWRFVDCPVEGHVKYCVNSRSKSSWLAVQPVNTVAGVSDMVIADQEMTLLDSGYFFVLKNSTVGMSAVDIELTSTTGETIKDTVALSAGKCATGSSNFGPSHQSKVLSNFDDLKYAGDYKAGYVIASDDKMVATARSSAKPFDPNLFLVAPVVLAAVGAVVAGAFAYVAKRPKEQVVTEEPSSLTSPFSTRSSSPAILSETIAKL